MGAKLIDRIMGEVALYGGLPLRRSDILRLAQEHMPGVREPFGPAYFAFHGPTVDLEPWPFEEAQRVMKAALPWARLSAARKRVHRRKAGAAGQFGKGRRRKGAGA